MLGRGVYTLAEVALYTKVAPSTVRAWFLVRSDRSGHRPIFDSEWQRAGEDFAVSFLNLIESHVAAFFKSRGVTPRHIRRVHEILKSVWKIKHPFAFEDLRTNGKTIVINRAKDARLIDVISKQMLFDHIGPELVGVDYRSGSKLAHRWRVADGVVINPEIGFGRPVIENTSLSTLIVANQYVANGNNASLVARLYQVPAHGVEKAYAYEVALGRVKPSRIIN